MIAVVFATRNGARTLPEMLPRLLALRAPPGGHRIVAVDNGSTDATPAILRDASAASTAPFAVLREPRAGKNRALNHALPLVSEASLVVLTDDDVLPEPDWLERLCAAAQANPGADILGGAIRPRWPGAMPPWIAGHGVPLGVVYGATDPRLPAGPVGPDLVWGPNMAIRGAVLRAGHRFDEGVGPDGAAASYGMGSETEFTTRLARAGHRAVFVPDAVVHHLVRPEQTEEAWVLGRAFRHGLGFFRYHPRPGRGRLPWIAGLPPRLAADLAAHSTAAAVARHLPRGRLRFRILWQAAWLRGAAQHLRRTSAPPPGAAEAPAAKGTAAG